MKTVTICILLGIVLIALILGVLPVAASESEGNMIETRDYLSQSHYYQNTLNSATTQNEYPFLTTTTNIAGNSLTYTLVNNPSYGTLSGTLPNVVYTPNPGFYGTDYFTFTVSDGVAKSNTATVTITVINLPPVLAFIGDKLAPEGKLIQFTINATDPNGDILTYTASNLPSGATFDSQSRTFFWTPGLGQQGTYPGIHFEVSDSELTDSEDVTITVVASEDAVISVNSLKVRPGKVNTGKQVAISVLATNSGTVAGSYEVTLRINGAIEGNRVVTLVAGATQEVNFATSENVAGKYLVDVNGLSGSFEVTAGNKNRPGRTVSLTETLSKTVGWIRAILNKAGDT